MPLVDHMEKICEFQRHSCLENCLFVSPSAKYMTTFKTLAPIIWSKVFHICIGNGTICQVKTDGENSPTCTIHGSPRSTERLHLDICFRKANAIPVLSTSYLCNSMYCVQMSKFKIADALIHFVQGLLKSSEIKTYSPRFTSHNCKKKKRKFCLVLGRWSTKVLASVHAVNVNNHPTGGCFGCANPSIRNFVAASRLA